MNDIRLHLHRARSLAVLLDSQWKFLGISFGIDPLLDIVPGITTLIPTVLSFYLFYIAIKFDLPQNVLVKMLINIGLDYLISSIPVLGFIGDIFYKSNLKNLKLLEDYAKKNGTIIEGEIVS